MPCRGLGFSMTSRFRLSWVMNSGMKNRAMLKGYREVRAYDRELLLHHVTHKVCRRYITGVALGKGTPKVAGMALVRSRMDTLTRLWLRGDYDQALVGVDT